MNRRVWLPGWLFPLCLGALSMSAGAATVVPKAKLKPLVAPAPTRICVTEWSSYYADPEGKIRARFALYKRLGVETLRLETGVMDHPALVQALKDYPFHIKYILYVLGMPPNYSMEHPDGRMVDERGTGDWHLGPWSPAFDETIKQNALVQLEALKRAGLANRVDEVAVDLGPAGEPIYPANWTLGREGQEAYWCYSSLAQQDFRKAMQAKYGDIGAALKVWGPGAAQQFHAWSDVAIPKPGTEWARGSFWNDMLVWYRDSKRRMVIHRIEQTQQFARQYLAPGAKCIVYLPGTAYSNADWDSAVAQASGPASIRLMMDNDWVMDEAIKRGCVLQYTGAENMLEVRNIVRKLRARGSRAYTTMWAENAGFEGAGRNPGWLADEIVGYGIRGVDYTWSNWLFEKDGVSLSPTVPAFTRAVRAIKAYRPDADPPIVITSPDLAREISPGLWRLDAVADTRIMNNYPDDIHGNDPEIAVMSGAQFQHLLLRFPVELLPKGKRIMRARLVLKRDGANDGDGPSCSLAVYRLLQPWRESSVTWRECRFGVTWQRVGGTVAPDAKPPVAEVAAAARAGDMVEWDVTTLVNQLAKGPNHGLAVVVGGKQGALRSFAAREHTDINLRPALYVELAN